MADGVASAIFSKQWAAILVEGDASRYARSGGSRGPSAGGSQGNAKPGRSRST